MPILIGTILIIVLAVSLAEVLRRLGAPGSRILGGVVAGILIGPTIFGRILPDSFERLMLGAIEQRAGLQRLEREHTAYQLAAGHARAEPADVESKQSVYEDHRAELEKQWRAAMFETQAVPRWTTLVLCGLVLIGVRSQTGRNDRVQFFDSLNIGVWAAAIPAGCVLGACWLWGDDLAGPGTILAMAGAGVGAWRPTATDIAAANAIEIGATRLVERAASFARAGAGIVLVVVAMRSKLATADASLMIFCGAMALLGTVIRPRDWGHVPTRIIIPILAGLAAARVEWLIDISFWPVVVFAVVSGDGRWIGAVLGTMVQGGRKPIRAMGMLLGIMAAGPTQLAVSAIGLSCELISPSIGSAMILGALLVDITEPARRMMAGRLAMIETQLDESEINPQA